MFDMLFFFFGTLVLLGLAFVSLIIGFGAYITVSLFVSHPLIFITTLAVLSVLLIALGKYLSK